MENQYKPFWPQYRTRHTALDTGYLRSVAFHKYTHNSFSSFQIIHKGTLTGRGETNKYVLGATNDPHNLSTNS